MHHPPGQTPLVPCTVLPHLDRTVLPHLGCTVLPHLGCILRMGCFLNFVLLLFEFCRSWNSLKFVQVKGSRFRVLDWAIENLQVCER